MYEEHRVFTPPPNEAVLWRYMDLPKFIAMLDARSLFFTRADKLGDPFEGSYSRMNEALRPKLYQDFISGLPLQRLISEHSLGDITLEQLKKDLIPERLIRDVSALARSQRQFTLLNCWHENDIESEAMWRLYSRERDGVAIKTSFECLKKSFTGDDTVNIGRVRYVDYNTDYIREDNAFAPYLHKRKSFEHELEVRAVVVKWPSDSEPTPVPGVGVNVAVDLDLLIQGVVVDGRAKDWIVELVQAIATKYNLGSPVTRSTLADEPYW